MAHTFDEIKIAVDKCLLPPKKTKDNLFDIGTRGFYENPFTEVFAYIISSTSHYKYRNEFVKSFLESIAVLSEEVIESFLLELKIKTQYTTLNSNYIDLLIYNSKYILVFENKVGHWLANPINDYESDIKYRYAHLIPHFLVLSYNPVDLPKPWTNVIIGNSFNSIKNSLPKERKDKWDFFVEDFLNHYIPVKSKFMTKDEFEFYANNFSKIATANNQINLFISEVTNKVVTRFPVDKIKRTVQHSAWGDSITKAVRLYPFDTDDNVVLVFRGDGKFSIAIYYYQNPKTYLAKLHELVGQSNYKNWKEGSVSCFAILDGKEFDTVHNLVDECASQLTTMMKFYDNKNFDIE